MKKENRKKIDIHQDVDLSQFKKKTNGTLKEFAEFATKGNLVDMAIGIVIGSAFTGIVNSLVNDIITPIISLITGKIDFTNMFVTFDGNTYPTLALAQEAGVLTLNYGKFLTIIINFLIVAFSIFILVKKIFATKKKEDNPQLLSAKICPYCKTSIHIDATRCPNCTSQLQEQIS